MLDIALSFENLFLAISVAVSSLLISYLLRKIVQAIATRLIPSWSTVLGAIAQFGTIFIGLALIIQLTGLISAAVLLTILTLFTAGASLSASNLIGNALATLQILTFGYYRKGDIVTVVGDVYGEVIEVNSFSTVIKTRSRDRLVVSNSAIISNSLRVHTGYEGREIEVHIPVCSVHDRKEVVDLLLNVGRSYRYRLNKDDMEPMVFHEYSSSSENYILVVFVDDLDDIRIHYSAISIAAGNMLNAHGISVGETDDIRNTLNGTLEIVQHRRPSINDGTDSAEPTSALPDTKASSQQSINGTLMHHRQVAAS